MNKILNNLIIVMLLFVSQSAFSFDPTMPPGPHLKTQYVPLQFDVLPKILEIRETHINVIDDTTVWTSIKVCARPVSPEDFVYFKFQVFDETTKQFYFLHMVTTWNGDLCSELTYWDIPVHVQHPLTFKLLAYNYGKDTINIRGWALLYAK